MKKVLSIAVALAVALSMLVVVPAGAVTEGTVQVAFNPECANLALGEAEYKISFHNDGLLLGPNDHIDVMFPTGTVLPADVDPIEVYKGTTRAGALGKAVAVNVTANRVTDKTVRLILEDEDQMIDKCDWVAIFVPGVTNPTSCDYHLQIGTSVAGPYVSADYTIYTAKVELVEGKNLISLPAYPADPAIEVVLAALFAEAAADEDFEFSVWYWDAWAQEWVIFASDTSFDDLAELHAGRAYWVKVSDDIDFKFKGDPYPECQGPPIKECYPPSWNMIGPAIQTDDVWASEYLFDATLAWPHQNTYAVSRIFGFDAGNQVFEDTGWRPGQRDDAAWMEGSDHPYYDTLLVKMEGYFMSFSGEACIIPPVPGVPDNND